MGIFSLQVSALMDNVTGLTVPKSYVWNIKFKCVQCDTVTDKVMSFSENDQVSLNSKNYANLVFSCKLCRRQSHVSFVEGSTRPYLDEYSPTFKPFAEFDCRGCDPVLFAPINPFICASKSNTQMFNEVDLSESNWADYDEKAQESVGIYEFKSKFEVIKKGK